MVYFMKGLIVLLPAMFLTQFAVADSLQKCCNIPIHMSRLDILAHPYCDGTCSKSSLTIDGLTCFDGTLNQHDEMKARFEELIFRSTSFGSVFLNNVDDCRIAEKVDTLYADSYPVITVFNSHLHPASFASLKTIIPKNLSEFCQMRQESTLSLFEVAGPAVLNLGSDVEKRLINSVECPVPDSPTPQTPTTLKAYAQYVVATFYQRPDLLFFFFLKMAVIGFVFSVFAALVAYLFVLQMKVNKCICEDLSDQDRKRFDEKSLKGLVDEKTTKILKKKEKREKNQSKSEKSEETESKKEQNERINESKPRDNGGVDAESDGRLSTINEATEDEYTNTMLRDLPNSDDLTPEERKKLVDAYFDECLDEDDFWPVRFNDSDSTTVQV